MTDARLLRAFQVRRICKKRSNITRCSFKTPNKSPLQQLCGRLTIVRGKVNHGTRKFGDYRAAQRQAQKHMEQMKASSRAVTAVIFLLVVTLTRIFTNYELFPHI
jgi:hypothetical protein